MTIMSVVLGKHAVYLRLKISLSVAKTIGKISANSIWAHIDLFLLRAVKTAPDLDSSLHVHLWEVSPK